MRKEIAATLLALAAGLASAQAQDTWPSKQVTIVVPFAAGGTTDMFGRIFANAMQAKTGKPFIVENRAGAGGNIGSAAVARAAPDGYTLVVGTISSHAINPSVYKNMPYDVAKDFQPISLIARLPNLLVINPKIPAKTVPEVIDYVKKNNGKLAYGSSGIGASNQLAAELFKLKTDTDITHVPYRSSGDIMNALMGGHIDMAFDNMTLAWPQAKSGNVRAIAVTTLDRSASAPEVPTIAETLPGFDASSWHGLFAPAGTPKPIVDRLAAEVKEIFSTPETTKVLAEVGAVATPMSPDAFAKFIAAETAKWAEVVKAAKIQQQ
jgi:tripartite-type tricarboxylate transporter receptor subunit TctC